MPRKAFLTLIPVLLVYAILTVYKPAGLMAYFFPILCWSFVALIVLRVCGFEKIKQWFSKPVALMAFLTAMLQIVALIFAGLFTSFGRSPYTFTPTAIAINIAYFTSPLIALELSRAYLINLCPKKKILMGIGLTAFFYAFISFSPTRFLALGTPADTAKFLGSDFLPTLAQSLLVTYLALLGGPAASISYLGTISAFEWLSPILPNPDWTIKALITTLVPAVGFLTVNQSVTPFTLMRRGIISREEATRRPRRTKKSPSLSWMATAIIAVILLWGSTGLLGFQPSIIASGSMTPTLNVGDIAITVPTRPENIQVGNMIQYWRQGEPAPVIHRVIEINQAGGTTNIITKGDANTAPDDPITPTRTIGKVIFTIPKLGWINIYLKTAFTATVSFISNNVTVAYATIALILTYLTFRIHKYRSQPLNKLKRKFRR